MVSWAGASKDAPDSLLTGSSNPAQFTTHKEIGTSRW
ncbi:TPA: ash family protein [Yersinia enterocolitica]|nr:MULTISPECIES: ash family protein [Yersinia]MDA5495765.1 ash family protein [Yersinia intermedia]MDA5512755.1 ash family protein [Yersinia intermedia]UYJ83265.1 ash family protein [Yersinia enterocolitica]UYK12712.1 ash family protein [Yersinia enterocolitica]HDL8434016.1 ash family protein [Yersinia enterocolitica]